MGSKMDKKMDRRSRIKTDRRFLAGIAFLILLGGICLWGAGVRARAAGQPFDIQAEFLPSGGETYDLRLTVGNQGQDWEGTVRLAVDGPYGNYYDCAYDTVLSLPQDSTKQFVAKVAKSSVDYSDGTVKVTLLDKKSQKSGEKVFKGILRELIDTLPMGILSDDYPALTYLDMGGEELYYDGNTYPISLKELNQDNLAASLDALAFLVIDKYNTGVLTDDEVSAIGNWVDAGGVLIVGTGSYAEDVFRGLNYPEIQYRETQWEEEDESSSKKLVDWSQLALVELDDTNGWGFDEHYDTLAWVCGFGDGAMGVLPYSLSELSGLDASAYAPGFTQEGLVQFILDEAGSLAHVRYGQLGYGVQNAGNPYLYYGYASVSAPVRMLRWLGNSNSSLHFGVLRFIIIAYVIFVGPILYLILRFLKKRELYWAAVPVTALVGILLVFWAGRGFEVVGARAYSVTVKNLSDRGSSRTYLLCYDAGYEEWELRLAEGYEYAAPLENNYKYNDDEMYYYHVKKEGDRLYFGMNPSAGFEDSFFCAGRAGDREAADERIVSDVRADTWSDVAGTVTNGTSSDFVYLAVLVDGKAYIYEGLPAGETCDLSTRKIVYYMDMDNSFYNQYMNGFVGASQGGGKKNADAAVALGVGAWSVYTQAGPDRTVVIGAAADWENVVDDNCSEMSYGCLYSIQ